MPERPWTDEFTLLCERCGYVIEGLDTGGACPECGKAISESLPERRVGTAWQQRPGLQSLLSTWWISIRFPNRTLANLQTSTPWLGLLTILVASSIGGIGFMAPSLVLESMQDDPELTSLAATILVFALVISIVLLGLTHIESRGLRLIAKSRGFRLGTPFATAIVDHASVGWILVALGYSIAHALGHVLVRLTLPTHEPTGSEMLDSYVQIFTAPPDWVHLVNWGLVILGVLPGFLFFKTFAWLGLRRCKFANRVRPEETSPERE